PSNKALPLRRTTKRKRPRMMRLPPLHQHRITTTMPAAKSRAIARTKRATLN
ncbi:hypothetical protein GGI14_006230, partial [Coemansia sp. S680]